MKKDTLVFHKVIEQYGLATGNDDEEGRPEVKWLTGPLSGKVVAAMDRNLTTYEPTREISRTAILTNLRNIEAVLRSGRPVEAYIMIHNLKESLASG
jgi:hypothetical protein